MMQTLLFDDSLHVKPFTTQLLKWVGNKQKFAHEIVGYFPDKFNRYYEPFLGSGAILSTLSPKDALASDAFQPLIEIFTTLKNEPNVLKEWYEQRWLIAHGNTKKDGYEKIKASYNANPNGADLLFLCRACYGGVVRFRKADGYMSTPCGVHEPIRPESFNKRTDIWHERVQHTQFELMDYKKAMRLANAGDFIYCDPPYKHSQAILYGGQDFKLEELFNEIEKCKKRGAYVALSIDGTKKSGNINCELPIPSNLFEEEIYVNVGRSMLKRFQMEGLTLEKEIVSDRLLLTYTK
ncbi:Dam family site-specific DNA-(adenine-N6)-methyltransferase [Candidatus Albibeggiatoa sp. nov. BB20]|uniref:Dam family site-specific DNA-(adenine-N6)-methyltransferase n=1 Tax=Candidatus Albibeggiatoa sp. nov. BB20 TaxID=3162723 RepID=UPI003365A9D2